METRQNLHAQASQALEPGGDHPEMVERQRAHRDGRPSGFREYAKRRALVFGGQRRRPGVRRWISTRTHRTRVTETCGCARTAISSWSPTTEPSIRRRSSSTWWGFRSTPIREGPVGHGVSLSRCHPALPQSPLPSAVDLVRIGVGTLCAAVYLWMSRSGKSHVQEQDVD